MRKSEQCFNSKMVRLKGAFSSARISASTRFNSNMVRLKDSSNDLLTMAMLFQFQYGSIKRGVPVATTSPKGSFNSKMVRLKGDVSRIMSIIIISFNSKMVLLKGLL